MITTAQIDAALGGKDPDLGHALTGAELGKRLAPHRRGRYAGQPFTRAAISLYRKDAGQQSADFEEAFLSWRAAERLRQSELRLRLNDLTVDELLGEQGYVAQLGDDPVKVIVAVGQLPPGTLISVNGTAKAVLCAAEVRQCACGRWFVARSWNQRRCRRDCKEAAREIPA